MDWKMFATVFGTVFLAELGDKTQLATLLFGVGAGALVSQHVNPRYLSYVAGVGFILIGIWTLLSTNKV